MTTLHYIYDPLCGWCYAAENLIDAAAGLRQVQIALHGGGLFSAAVHLPSAKRDYIRQADARIGQMSGQVFGDAYLKGLLADPGTVYDSRPPIAAMLAAQSLRADSGLAMLKALQHAHYREGQRIVEPEVLMQIAVSIGLGADTFSHAYTEWAGARTDHHIESSRKLMQRIGTGGFPAFMLENGGRLVVLRHEGFYGRPQEFSEMLKSASFSLGKP